MHGFTPSRWSGNLWQVQRDTGEERHLHRAKPEPGPRDTRPAPGQSGTATRASKCGNPIGLVPVCRCFEPPRRTQLKRWKALRADYLARDFTYL